MRLILKLKESSVIFIVQLWIFNFVKTGPLGYLCSAFMKILLKHFGELTLLTTDKVPALLFEFYKLKNKEFIKKQRSLQRDSTFSMYNELQQLLATSRTLFLI